MYKSTTQYYCAFPPAPTAPRHLTVVGKTSTSVDLNWIHPLHPNGVIHYEIEFSKSENFLPSKITINTGSNNTYYTVNGVSEVSRYYFRVLSVNTDGVGRSSSSNVVNLCLEVEVGESKEIVIYITLYLVYFIPELTYYAQFTSLSL